MQYKTELHAHSSEVSPCADFTVEQVADRYLEAGYTSLCLTNHFIRHILERGGESWEEQVDWFLRPVRLMQSYVGARMHILAGAELRFDDHDNDYLLYGITREFMLAHPYFYEMKLKDFTPLARENGILVIQAHPFRNRMKVIRPDMIDGIEMFNGHAGHDSRNDLAELWSKKYKLLRTSGSDFHHPHSVIGAGILTDEPVTSIEQLTEILRTGDCTLICRGPAAERDGMCDMPAALV